jgi:hypothetical protein
MITGENFELAKHNTVLIERIKEGHTKGTIIENPDFVLDYNSNLSDTGLHVRERMWHKGRVAKSNYIGIESGMVVGYRHSVATSLNESGSLVQVNGSAIMHFYQ